jgi:hypothetical protein
VLRRHGIRADRARARVSRSTLNGGRSREVWTPRREFITLFGGAAIVAWPFATSHAQPDDRVRRIGVLMLYAENDSVGQSIVVGKILEKDAYAFGYDAQTGEYGNLVSKGIIDPTKVVRVALQGAASVAGLLITTEAMVAELPRKQGSAMPGGAGGGMGGMGGMDF